MGALCSKEATDSKPAINDLNLKKEASGPSTDGVPIVDLEHYINNPDDEKSKELCA